jgi:Baseplate J-like protein
MTISFPIVIGPAGLQPTPPATILTELTASVTAEQPGYTNNLPGILIEDISSTVVGAIELCNQAQVEAVNSLTPLGANVPLLTQLGQVYGVPLGQATNTSVVVVFTGTVDFVIAQGFLISDGTYSYQLQSSGVIGTSGSSQPMLAVAVQSGAWTIAQNTVTTLQTSVPPGITLSVNNPTAGTPSSAQQSYDSYRAEVLQAGLAACVGSARFIKTQLGTVTGITPNLIAVQQATGGFRVIAGGGDPYQTALAIFRGIDNPAFLQGSAVSSARNNTVSLNDFPDTYSILYVNPVEQPVTMTVTWNTTLPDFTGGAAFPGLVQQPLVDYLNGLYVGQPINVLEMNAIFQEAIAGVLDPTLLTRLVFAVFISSTLVPPGSGTYAVSGDPEGYFFATTSGITVVQG